MMVYGGRGGRASDQLDKDPPLSAGRACAVIGWSDRNLTANSAVKLTSKGAKGVSHDMRRRAWVRAAALALSAALILAGCGSGATPEPTPPQQSEPQPTPKTPQEPDTPSPSDAPEKPEEPDLQIPELPGDMEALREALRAPSPITYTIVIAHDAPREMDKTAYLDQMLAEKGYPGKNEILLVLFPADNYNIRFAMGALVFDRKITLPQMLELVQTQYLTRSRQGDPAGGLAALINAINQQAR